MRMTSILKRGGRRLLRMLRRARESAQVPSAEHRFSDDLQRIRVESVDVAHDPDELHADLVAPDVLAVLGSPARLGSALIRWLIGVAAREGKQQAVAAFWRYSLEHRRGEMAGINAQIGLRMHQVGWFDETSDAAIVELQLAVRRKLHVIGAGEFDSLLNAVGFMGLFPYGWTRRIADLAVVDWIADLAGYLRYDLLEEVVARFAFFVGLRTQSEQEFLAFFDRLRPAFQESGARCRALYERHTPTLPRMQRDRRKIAFVATDAHISGSRMALSIVDGIRRSGLDFEPSFHILRGESPELSTACADLDCELVSYDLQCRTGSYLDRFFAIKERLARDGIYTAVWTHLPWIAPAAFAIELAPNQALLCQHLAVAAVVDAPFTNFMLEGTGGATVIRHGVSWKCLPLTLCDLVPERPAAARALRVEFLGGGSVLLGTIARPEKINNPEFLGLVCDLLASSSECRFVWTGESRMLEVQQFFERRGVAGQTVFAGWVDPAACAAAFDLYLDSFPFASGMTAVQAMVLSVPVISLRSRYSLLGRDVADAYEAKDAPAELQRELRSLFDPLKRDGLLPIADDRGDYSRLARRLIGDEAARQRLGAALKRTAQLCFEDTVRMAQIFTDHLSEQFPKPGLFQGDSAAA